MLRGTEEIIPGNKILLGRYSGSRFMCMLNYSKAKTQYTP